MASLRSPARNPKKNSGHWLASRRLASQTQGWRRRSHLRQPSLSAGGVISVDAELKLSWADWLNSQPWHYFLTITCRDPLPTHRADSVLNAIGKTLCATHKPEMVFLGAEPHLSRLMHFHGLYRSTVTREQPEWWWKLCATDIWASLFSTFGRSSVDLIKCRAAVAEYVSKYCVKDLGSYAVFGRSDWQ